MATNFERSRGSFAALRMRVNYSGADALTPHDGHIAALYGLLLI
jgi:hypothetical protein